MENTLVSDVDAGVPTTKFLPLQIRKVPANLDDIIPCPIVDFGVLVLNVI